LAKRPPRLGGEKKGLYTSSISQWPSASEMTGDHNKTRKAGDSAKKFAANIPYTIGNLCSKFGGNWFIFTARQHSLLCRALY